MMEVPENLLLTLFYRRIFKHTRIYFSYCKGFDFENCFHGNNNISLYTKQHEQKSNIESFVSPNFELYNRAIVTPSSILA